ncbi:MAG: FHA domain-containing protein [Thermoleophilaceae bacterium]|nr:FHA domain-containing protein [Thermoleophilaceae bacterium]
MAGDADPLAILLKFGFLAVLYLFLLFIARSAMRDLRRGEELPAAAGTAGPGRDGAAAAAADGPPVDLNPRLEVVAGKGHQSGREFDVRAGARLGRSQVSEVHIDDSYASAAHARLYPRAGAVFIEDLGSTNGTYVNERALTRPLQLVEGDTVRIGDTELRYRE